MPHVTIGHDSRVKIAKDIVFTLIILAATIVSSYRFTFGSDRPDLVYWIIFAAYLFDIPYGFLQSVKKGLEIHSDRRNISRAYFRGWFILDVLCIIPFTVFFGTSPAAAALSFVAVLKALKLVKILKVGSIFRDIRQNLNVNPALMRLVTFAFWFVVAVHVMACGWCLIGASEEGRPQGDQYLRALYWVVTTIATIGYGDYYPDHDSNLQIVYTIIVQVFGVGMYGYIIGNVASLIANLDVARAEFQKKMEEINNFLRTARVPSTLQSRVRDYYAYLWETRQSVSSVPLVSELPHTLSLDILLFLNRTIIEKVSIFKNAGEIFVREVVQLLRPLVFLPGDYIIRQGEYGDCMYFLSKGDVTVSVNDVQVATLGQGSPFGETALLQGEKRMASIRAVTYCDAYKLSKEDFDLLRRKYPDFDAQVKQVVEDRRRDTAEKTKGKPEEGQERGSG